MAEDMPPPTNKGPEKAPGGFDFDSIAEEAVSKYFDTEPPLEGEPFLLAPGASLILGNPGLTSEEAFEDPVVVIGSYDDGSVQLTNIQKEKYPLLINGERVENLVVNLNHSDQIEVGGNKLEFRKSDDGSSQLIPLKVESSAANEPVLVVYSESKPVEPQPKPTKKESELPEPDRILEFGFISGESDLDKTSDIRLSVKFKELHLHDSSQPSGESQDRILTNGEIVSIGTVDYRVAEDEWGDFELQLQLRPYLDANFSLTPTKSLYLGDGNSKIKVYFDDKNGLTVDGIPSEEFGDDHVIYVNGEWRSWQKSNLESGDTFSVDGNAYHIVGLGGGLAKISRLEVSVPGKIIVADGESIQLKTRRQSEMEPSLQENFVDLPAQEEPNSADAQSVDLDSSTPAAPAEPAGKAEKPAQDESLVVFGYENQEQKYKDLKLSLSAHKEGLTEELRITVDAGSVWIVDGDTIEPGQTQAVRVGTVVQIGDRSYKLGRTKYGLELSLIEVNGNVSITPKKGMSLLPQGETKGEKTVFLDPAVGVVVVKPTSKQTFYVDGKKIEPANYGKNGYGLMAGSSFQVDGNAYHVIEVSEKKATLERLDLGVPGKITLNFKDKPLKVVGKSRKEMEAPLVEQFISLDSRQGVNKVEIKKAGKKSLNRPLKEIWGMAQESTLLVAEKVRNDNELIPTFTKKGLRELVASGATIASVINPALGFMMAAVNVGTIATRELITVWGIRGQIESMIGKTRTDGAVKQLKDLGIKESELDLIFDSSVSTNMFKLKSWTKKSLRLRGLLDKLYFRQTSFGKTLLKENQLSQMSPEANKLAIKTALVASSLGIVVGEVFRKSLPVVGSLSVTAVERLFSQRMRQGVLQFALPRLVTLAVGRAGRHDWGDKEMAKFNEETASMVGSIMTAYYTILMAPAMAQAGAQTLQGLGQLGNVAGAGIDQLIHSGPEVAAAVASETLTPTTTPTELHAATATPEIPTPTEAPTHTPTPDQVLELGWDPGEASNLDQVLQIAQDHGWVEERGDLAYYYLDNAVGPDVVVQTNDNVQIEYVKNTDGNFWRDYNGDGILDQAIYAPEDLVPPDLLEKNVSGGKLNRPALNPELGEPLPLTVDFDGDGKTEIIQGDDGKYYLDLNNDNQITPDIDLAVDNQPQVTHTATGYQIDRLELSNGSVWSDLKIDYSQDAGGTVMTTGLIDHGNGSSWEFAVNEENPTRPMIIGKLTNGQTLIMDSNFNFSDPDASASLSQYQYELARLHPEWTPDEVGQRAMQEQIAGTKIFDLAGVEAPTATPEPVSEGQSKWITVDGEKVGVLSNGQHLILNDSVGWTGEIQERLSHLGNANNENITPDIVGRIATLAAGNSNDGNWQPVYKTFNTEVGEISLRYLPIVTNAGNEISDSYARGLVNQYLQSHDLVSVVNQNQLNGGFVEANLGKNFLDKIGFNFSNFNQWLQNQGYQLDLDDED